MLKIFSFILVAIIPAFYSGSVDRDTMNEIEKNWKAHDTRIVFKTIVESIDSGKNLDIDKLVKLTGVYPIEKVLEGRGDETAYFIGDKYILLSAFTPSFRIYEISTNRVYSVSEKVYPVWDRSGLVVFKETLFYFLREENQNYSLYEYDLATKKVKPIGYFPIGMSLFRFDAERGLLQVTDTDERVIRTFDLQKRSVSPDNTLIKRRESNEIIDVEAKPETNELKMEFNGKWIGIPYPRDEYLDGNIARKLTLDGKHPDTILITSMWYPGLRILFNLNRKESTKIFLPEWLDPDTENLSWRLIGKNLYIWRDSGEKAGLYLIRLDVKIKSEKFVKAILDFKLARRKSDVGQSNAA